MNLIYTKKKMLQLKKIFHLKHYIIAYSSLKCIFNYNLLYIINKKKLISLFLLLVFIKYLCKHLIKKIYIYILNTKLFNLDILNSKILNFWLFFNNIKNLNFNLKFNSISKKKKIYTVLRSPFVHKTSREQFLFQILNGIIRIVFINLDICLIHYWELLLKKKMIIFFSFNLIIKRNIYTFKIEI